VEYHLLNTNLMGESGVNGLRSELSEVGSSPRTETLITSYFQCFILRATFVLWIVKTFNLYKFRGFFSFFC
jgi:hypothetical protein